jgi:hypothetical protein
MSEKVATGIWYYDGQVPRPVSIHRKEARLAESRFNYDTDGEPVLDETRPIPETKDGYLYFCSSANSGDLLSVDDVKAWADAQPWGPVKWDDEVS